MHEYVAGTLGVSGRERIQSITLDRVKDLPSCTDSVAAWAIDRIAENHPFFLPHGTEQISFSEVRFNPQLQTGRGDADSGQEGCS